MNIKEILKIEKITEAEYHAEVLIDLSAMDLNCFISFRQEPSNLIAKVIVKIHGKKAKPISFEMENSCLSNSILYSSKDKVCFHVIREIQKNNGDE